MAILKGQNLRILASGLDGSDMAVIGMATNCTVTLTNNTDDASTKDDVGNAAKPEVVSNAWSVQVDSLNVANVASLLGIVKGMSKILLMWDEVGTTDNQTPVASTAFARQGYAYLSDATFTFNNRENSAKSLQFTGASELTTVPTSGQAYEVLDPGSYTKGQFVRLFLGSDNTTTPAKVIGSATQLKFHVSLQMESASTKDTTGTFDVQEPVGLSYDITSNALVRGGDSITSAVQAQGLSELEAIYEAGTPVKFQIANASGANQRTKGAVIVSGSVILTQLTINAPNRQNATYDAQFNGWGAYTVGA